MVIHCQLLAPNTYFIFFFKDDMIEITRQQFTTTLTE